MHRLHNCRIAVLLGTLALWLNAVQAEQYMDAGEYVIHYNAFPSEMLSPQVARAYGITRSNNRAMLNVTVLRKLEDGSTVPVRAAVAASASNLTGQFRTIETRLIEEQDARYSIGTVRIRGEEVLNFRLEITPDGESEPIELRFSHRFDAR